MRKREINDFALFYLQMFWPLIRISSELHPLRSALINSFNEFKLNFFVLQIISLKNECRINQILATKFGLRK